MKRNIIKKIFTFTLPVFIIAVCMYLYACNNDSSNLINGTAPNETDAAAGPNSTAQSIGASFNGVTNVFLDLTSNTSYTFTPADAFAWFDVNTSVSVSGPTCTGGGPGGVNCALANQPPAPAQPPIGSQANANGKASSNSCEFWNGTAISFNYVISVTVPGLNNSGNWKWTYTYTVAGTPPAQTAWVAETIIEGETTADVSTQIDITSESILMKGNPSNAGTDAGCVNNWNKKYSFSLKDGDLGTRVLGVTVFFQQSTDAGATWFDVSSYPVGDINDITNSEFAYSYTANGGSFGNASAIPYLIDGQNLGDICSNTGSPASRDNFCGNNNTSSGGGDWASVAHVGTTPTNTVPAGTYRYRVEGTLKGNTGIANQSFSIIQDVNITTCEPCGPPCP